jgi:NAD(P)-dependent dehydrogenase (short-subunit alcohol dehydrogenase family)
VLFAVEANRRWAADGITANAVHPGAIVETNLSRHMDPEQIAALRAAGAGTSPIDGAQMSFKTIPEGAATSVLVATSPQLEGVGGHYFEDCNEAAGLAPDAPTNSTAGVAPYALDPDTATRLWELSLTSVA